MASAVSGAATIGTGAALTTWSLQPGSQPAIFLPKLCRYESGILVYFSPERSLQALRCLRRQRVRDPLLGTPLDYS